MVSTDPHTHLPARTTTVGDEFWFAGWLWEAALVEVAVRRDEGPRAMIRARSLAPPHHYATLSFSPNEMLAYLHKEYA